MPEKTFTIPRDPWGVGKCIYKKSRITIRPGVTVLVGCNGAGKTTLMHLMKQALKDQGIPLIAFDNLHDGGDRARSAAGFFGDVGFLAAALQSSEGENILMNIGKFARDLGAFVRRNQNASEMWVFFDAVDSGFSIDNIDDFKQFLHDMVLEDARGRDVYIVIATNSHAERIALTCRQGDTFGLRITKHTEILFSARGEKKICERAKRRLHHDG